MNLNESLESYRNITLELIDAVKTDDNLDVLFDQRQNIIKNIESLNFDKHEFKELAISFNILELEDKLQKTINEEKIKVKNKINLIRKTREARDKYENSQFKPTLFNKKF